MARFNASGNRFVPGKHISNPFLTEKQKTPSFNIYFSHHSREWRFKDFATGDDGSCFDLVMKLFNLNFTEALQKISSSMGLNIAVHNENTAFTQALHPSAKPIEYGLTSLIVRPFLFAELEWWKFYGISEKVLQQFKVHSVNSFSAINKTGKPYKIESTADNPVYAYVYEKWAKLYKPKAEKYRFQYLGEKPIDYLFGFEQLPDFLEYIFLTGGEKDVMSLTAHGFAAVSLNSETAMLTPEALTLLKSRCRFLIVLYDNDETGLKQGEKIAKENNLPRIVLPAMEKGKDISDYFKNGLPVSDLHQLIESACKSFDSIPAQAPEPSRLEKVLITREILAKNKSQKITFSNPILWQNDNPVFFPKTINVIQGKAGVHKSRLAQIISSSLLKTPFHDESLLGFVADPAKSYAICYVDTERNLSEQLPYALQQIQIHAGYSIEDHPQNFDYISLLEFDRKERFEVLNEYLEYIRTKYNRHVFIILDVITDCVYNFNDAKDSMALIDMMNISINRYDVTFLCLIHENPGSTDKARGHLGTEIMNKASTVVQVGFERDNDRRDTDLIKVTYLKCRSSKKHEPFYVKYSDIEHSLVLADAETINDFVRNKKIKLNINAFANQLEFAVTKPISRRDLLDCMIDEFDCSERIVEDYIKDIISNKTVLRNHFNMDCHLIKSKQGKTLMYSLQPVNEKQAELALDEPFNSNESADAPF